MAKQEEFERRYAKLNVAQKTAVDTIEGPLLVIAGPGSGKTEILAMRAANILKQTDTDPASVLCLTFTESAAANMRSRLASLIGSAAYRVSIHTFHSLGADIIARAPERFFGGASVSPAPETVAVDVMDDILAKEPHDSPIVSKKPEGGYVYTRPILSAIADVKKAGITPEELSLLIDHNERWMEEVRDKAIAVLGERVSKQSADAWGTFAREVSALSKDLHKDPFPIARMKSWIESFADVIAAGALAAQQSESTEPIKAAKERLLAKDEEGVQRLADEYHLPKQRAFARAYAAYRSEMIQRGYLDFDDLLMEAIHALERDAGLRADLQERYQYILIDEFQDTNDAQLRLAYLLSDPKSNEERPNIMVVGDDDQAIYKFQGASSSNIFDFQRLYPKCQIVTMTNNYRSSQHVLDISRQVIVQSDKRFEDFVKDVSKIMKAEGIHKDAPDTDIRHHRYATDVDEYDAVAKDIAQQIQKGIDPETIAVIARKHDVLTALVPHLVAHNVPIRYKRRADVLQLDPIVQLLGIARYLATNDAGLLPDILSYPWWKIERRYLWETARDAREKKVPFFDAVMTSPHDCVRSAGECLVEWRALAAYAPCERVIDAIVGPDIDNDDAPVNMAFKSKFRSYYYDERPRSEHILFLSALRTFVSSVREHMKGRRASISDLVLFVDKVVAYGMPLYDESPYASAEKAVTLITAHAVKGLEYEHVYVVDCSDKTWIEGRGHISMRLPINLPVHAEKDDASDIARLFYVALTRAQHHLSLSSHKVDSKGKEKQSIRFLVPSDEGALKKLQQRSVEFEPSTEPHALARTLVQREPLSADEKAILREMLTDYRMSVTHLNTFLDVVDRGPDEFIEKCLLRFPQSKSPDASYGTAIHAAIRARQGEWKRTGAVPSYEWVITQFNVSLGHEKLLPDDFTRLSVKGNDHLTNFLKYADKAHADSDYVEKVLFVDGVNGTHARLTGTIDRVIVSDDRIIIKDVKTGKPFYNWDAKSGYEGKKAWDYSNQLNFYALLVSEHVEFAGKKIEKATLEFADAEKASDIELEYEIDPSKVARVRKLAEAVYTKIINLDFPDVSGYSKDRAGIEKFEEDLLSTNPQT